MRRSCCQVRIHSWSYEESRDAQTDNNQFFTVIPPVAYAPLSPEGPRLTLQLPRQRQSAGFRAPGLSRQQDPQAARRGSNADQDRRLSQSDVRQHFPYGFRALKREG